MKSTLPKILLLMVIGFSLIHCTEDRDEYYKDPSWVAPPLYAVLQQEGRFTNYLE